MGFFRPPDIGKLITKRDVNGLIKALRHDDPRCREKAAEALGKLRDPRAVRPFAAMLDDYHQELDFINDILRRSSASIVQPSPRLHLP